MPYEEFKYQSIRKSTLYWLIIIVIANLFLIGLGQADAQLASVVDGRISETNLLQNQNSGDQKESALMTEIVCKELNFWTVDVQGAVLQWQVAGNTVSLTDTIFTSSPIISLAYADNLNSGSITRTFYGTNTYQGSDVYYYNGQDWDTVPFPGGATNPNAGGYQSFLYFQALIHNSFCDGIIRYDGVHQDTIFVLPSGLNFSIADIAVDALGNIWCTVGTQLQSDSIVVINPSGNIIRSFALSMNTLHGYGCFLMNDEFYIVFGNGNPQYPSSIVRFGFSGNQASVQQVIPFPYSDYSDVASCIPGVPLILGIKSAEQMESALELSPNPVGSMLHIRFPSEQDVTPILIVYDMTGREVLKKEMNHFDQDLELSGMEKGLYLLRILSGQKMYTSQFVKD